MTNTLFVVLGLMDPGIVPKQVNNKINFCKINKIKIQFKDFEFNKDLRKIPQSSIIKYNYNAN
jgi:hypothetical protein